MPAGMASGGLVLRDVHVPAAPSWWPPAPGWWLVFALVALALAVGLAFAWRRRRRRRSWERLFEAAANLPPSGERVAAVSELLRRAARKCDPAADKLDGEAWLRFLDGRKRGDFSGEAGRLLLDGAYRRDVDEADVARLLPLARARFLELMAGKKS